MTTHKWRDIRRTPTECKRRTDIPPERDWSTPTKCERGTVWEGEWRWISYRAYSVNLCLSDNQTTCDDFTGIGDLSVAESNHGK